MKSILAFTVIWAITALGVALGLNFCVAVGYALGLAFHAPLSGALCGLVWYLFGWCHTCNGIAERNAQRVARLASSM